MHVTRALREGTGNVPFAGIAVRVQKWIGSTGLEFSWEISGPGEPIGVGGHSSGAPGFDSWDPSSIAGLKANVPSVMRMLSRPSGGHWPYAPGGYPAPDTDTSPFTRLAKAAALLADEPLRPAARAAVFRAIAHLPGLRYVGPTHDPLGRRGVAVAETSSTVRPFDLPGPQRYELELIFDPTAGTVLGYRTIALQAPSGTHLKRGGVVVSWAYLPFRAVPQARIPTMICAGNNAPGPCERNVRAETSRELGYTGPTAVR